MQSKSIPITKYILIYGILFGIVKVIYSLTTYLTGNYTDQGLINLIILVIITVSAITIGQLMFKKNNGSFINLKESLLIAIGICLLGGVIYLSWKILLIKVIDPEINSQIEDNHIKRIAETSKDFTQENIERTLEISRKYSSTSIIIVKGILEDIFFGSLFGLISGLIIRKKRDPFK